MTSFPRQTPKIKIDFCRDETAFTTGQGKTTTETGTRCVNKLKLKYKKSERSKGNRSKLWDAIMSDQPGDILRIVKEEGIQINELSVHEAAYEGRIECVKALLDCGAKVNSLDAEGWTALHAAVLGGHVDLVRLLIQRGADLYAETNEKYIPFHIATEKGDENMVALLVEKMSQLSALNAN